MNSRERRRALRRGRWAEILCAVLLRLKGYSILARGHRRRKGSGAGEIDIVARRGDLVVLVEVKARHDAEAAAVALTGNQRRRLTRAAAAFLAGRADLAGCGLRFDVMLVTPWRWPRHLMDAWRDAV